MASSDLDHPSLFTDAFKAGLGERSAMSFAEFMQIALYHPQCGYYRAKRTRVGRHAEADFYTSESFRGVLSELVAASAVHLLGEADPGSFTLVEIGSEPGGGLCPEAFAAYREFRSIRLEDDLPIPNRSVVFSNELYDAQPFHRVVHRSGNWVESGVTLNGDRLEWTDLTTLSAPVVGMRDRLPGTAAEGTLMDLPIPATEFLRWQVAPEWEGVFIAADYGKSWTALCEDCPAGTLRAYRNHRQTNDLLADPGRQDLTGHICWDWMEDILRQHRFTQIQVASQEAFFIHNAPRAIESIITESGGPLSERHSQLKTLLHPGLMGQKFQVISGKR